MRNVRIKYGTHITESDVKDLGHKIRDDNEKSLAWILVTELIIFLNNKEKTLLAQASEKARKNAFLKENKDFMEKLNRGFTKNDVQYLEEVRENIKP